jgi:hypothetical protein
MSISLALIPVALALRVVMGKANFENWVNSLQVKIPTGLTSEMELILTVKKAGYDLEKWGGSYKTHIQGERKFFFWEYIEGKWTAVFAKSDPKEMIFGFIQDMEKKAGRSVFNYIKENQTKKLEVVPTRTYPTNFRNAELLRKTLSDHGANPQIHTDGEITCAIGESDLRFRPVGEGPYSVEIKNAPDVREMFQHLATLDENYRRCVQAQTLAHLKQRIQDKNLTIESEQTLADQSIVITLNVGE